MARHSDRPVKTFSIGFAGVGKANELSDARRVAAQLGTEHHELELSLAGPIEVVERLAWHMDEPVRSLSALGFLALSDLAAQEVTVALSGQGADELFGGYRKHRVASLAATWHRLPAAVRAPIAAAGRRGPGEIRRLAVALQAPDPVSRLIASSGLLRPDLREGLFSGALAEQADAAQRCRCTPSRRCGAGDAARGASAPRRAARPRRRHAALFRSRLHGALARGPGAVPRPPARRDSARGCLIRSRCAGGRRSTSCAWRPRASSRTSCSSKPKLGFFGIDRAWLAADDAAVVERTLRAPDARYAEILDRSIVEQHISEWRAGAGDRSEFLLAMVMLEVWLSSYLPRSFAAARGDAVALAG